MEGCTFSGVMAQLGKYLPIGLSALTGVANIVAPGAGTAVSALIGLIQAAWGGLQGAVNTYNSAPSTSKQTELEKVLQALDAVQGQIGQTTQALGIGGTTAVKAASAALLLITTTLGSIEAQLAPKAAPVVANTHLAHASARSVQNVTVNSSIPLTGKPADFKKAFNEVMQQAGRSDLALR
jgi:hypothetical protein